MGGILWALALLSAPSPALANGLQEAQKAYAAGDFLKAYGLYEPLALAGDPQAQNNLGVMILKGQGVSRNSRVAAGWFGKAAEQGLADGQYHLGLMFGWGKGVAKSRLKAALWFQKAAAQGHAAAMDALKEMSILNTGTPLCKGTPCPF